eukprot:Filipodium_phascolosomae@DN754_c0_g1_i2.p1
MKSIVNTLSIEGTGGGGGGDFRLCCVYCIDSTFITETSKFISGCLVALASMIQLEMPHINLLTKCDLVPDLQEVHQFLDQEPSDLLAELHKSQVFSKYSRLNEALVSLLDDYSLVSFLALNSDDEESITTCLAQIDNAIQYGEDLDVRASTNQYERMLEQAGNAD